MRLLQDTEEKNSSNTFEFVEFLAWALFLAAFFLIPAACIYCERRRQRQRTGASQQTDNSRHNGEHTASLGMRAQGEAYLYFARYVASYRDINSPTAPKVSTKQIRDALATTTMKVEEKDLLYRRGETGMADECSLSERSLETAGTCLNNNDDEEEQASNKDSALNEDTDNESHLDSNKENADNDVEMGGTSTEASTNDIDFQESQQEYSHLQLPVDCPNGNRFVPSACAVCLCPYEVGDQVTWSPGKQCQHAFHRDCIVSCFRKKREFLCPYCRQEFCTIKRIPTPLSASRHNDDSV